MFWIRLLPFLLLTISCKSNVSSDTPSSLVDSLSRDSGPSVRLSEPRTACCWCKTSVGSNSVFPFQTTTGCKPYSPDLHHCRRIDAIATACSLFKISKAQGEWRCTPAPLSYKEGNFTQTVAPPPQEESPCRSMNHAAHLAMFPETRPIASAEGTAAVSVTSCYCQRDAELNDHCTLTQVSPSGEWKVLDSQAMLRPKAGCNRTVCRSLFQDFHASCQALYAEGG
jgi:hypothetical protein